MLVFKNHYLERYRDYLLEQIASGDEVAMIEAMRRLEEIVFPDCAIGAAIDSVIEQAHSELRRSAETAHARWQAMVES